MTQAASHEQRPRPVVASHRRVAAARSWWRRRLPAVALVALALAPYIGTLGYGFIDFDDQVTIVGLRLIRDLRPSTLAAFFRPDIYPGLPEYMPLKNLSYAVDYACFGLWAPGYRLQQLLWHALSVVWLWGWLRALLARGAAAGRVAFSPPIAEMLAFATAALFALHPCHVESVTWLSGRKDVLSGAFMIAALDRAFAWQPAQAKSGRTLWLAFALATAALLSKPMAVVLPLLAWLQDASFGPSQSPREQLRARWPLYLGLCSLSALLLAVYLPLVRLHASATSAVAAWLYHGPAWLRVTQQLLGFTELSFAPLKLAPLYPSELLAQSALDLRGALGLGVGGAVLAATGYGVLRRRPFGFALALFVVALAPVLVAPAWAQYVAARYLYLAVAGALLALLWPLAIVLSQRAHMLGVARIACALLAAFFLLTTLDYNRRWQSGLALWLGSLEVYPRFTEFHLRAARAALREGRGELAPPLLENCLKLEPRHAECSAELAALLGASDPARAERLLRNALGADTTGDAHFELARLLVQRGRAVEAAALYERWLNGRAVGVEQVTGLAQLYLIAQRPDDALRVTRQVVRAGAVNHPAGPPPAALLRDVARASGQSGLEAAIDRALTQCNRVDCVARALGW